MRYTYIDLFAGTSALSEGFLRCGFMPVAHVEMNSDACYTIKTRLAHHYLKANDSYYLLKKTATPIVIVECGFLSNREEADKLCQEEYQEKTAWAICMGILRYLNDK